MVVLHSTLCDSEELLLEELPVQKGKRPSTTAFSQLRSRHGVRSHEADMFLENGYEASLHPDVLAMSCASRIHAVQEEESDYAMYVLDHE